MLKDILTISGKSGLYRLISHGNNMIIVEALQTGERFPVYSNERISSLNDISVFTLDGDIPLRQVLSSMKEKENGQIAGIDVKKASKEELYDYFKTILPNLNRDKIYPTDIQKAIKWYNILIEKGLSAFDSEETDASPKDKEATTNKTAEHKNVGNKRTDATSNNKVQVKKSKSTEAKTGVGTRKG